ncbi:spondin domain-containing protein [Fortiea sp. LEGE XX443]|uniref:spondin domain-containing protein n=1 Tax=Fortiea sp. LEGE XX443 TaxID=1828611 RepID=UPI0018822905|nr:spondin domain-containing protein [Fortiea sp. LEGE XX443]MBE9007873.1 spondin domain-containing protein [Fortiea sp. LEGE XX443]
MKNRKNRNLKATLIGLSATLAIASNPSNAQAATFQVSVENLAPQNGQVVAPLWFSFHDGSFDTLNAGEPDPGYIEFLAEDGITGDPQGRLTPEVIAQAAALGLDLSRFPAPQNLLSGAFAASSAGQNGGYQDLVTFTRREDPFFGTLLPGKQESLTFNFNADPARNRFFSYAAMVGISNDAFIANDEPNAVEIFDAQGNFKGADFIVLGNQVWDAGTEVNSEDPNDVPYFLSEVFNSIPENGVVRLHSGLLPPGGGGIVDFEVNGQRIAANADFSVPGYQIARIRVTRVPEAGTTTSLLALGGLLLLGRTLRRKKSIECC